MNFACTALLVKQANAIEQNKTTVSTSVQPSYSDKALEYLVY